MYNIQYSSSGAKDSHNSFTSREKNFAFTFGQRTWHWACLVFTMLTIKKTTNKVHFLQYDICIKTLCTTLYLSLH